MAEYFNITAREHVEMRVSKEKHADEGYSETTGRREVRKYTGRFEEMLEQAEEELAAGGGALQVSCEVERVEAGIGELTVTREWMRKADEPEEDGGEEEPGESTDHLGTEDAPCYTMSSTPVTVSILAHPKFAGMNDLERRALKALIDGQDSRALIEEDSSGGYVKIRDCIISEAGMKAYEYIMRGVVEYLDCSTEATLRWRGRSNKYAHGEIVETLPGGFKSGQGRNWMCVGAGVEQNGGVTWCTAIFRLSGIGGWDKYLYNM